MKKLLVALCVLSGYMMTACENDCDKTCDSSDCNCTACENEEGYCGNGTIELGEHCDGVNFAAATCATVMGPGCTGELMCSTCKIDTSHCTCPVPETKLCGNGKLDSGEQCDKTNFGTATCDSMMPGSSGQLQCKDDCTIDLAGCSQSEPADPACGNGKLDSGEQCDKTNFGTATCESMMPGSSGQLQCKDDCTIDLTGCSQSEPPVPVLCGNGKVETGEQCDDGNVKDGDGCSKNCKKEDVKLCGNGEIDSGEQCDTNHFGGYTCGIKCAEAGMAFEGAFTCTDQCMIDESACKCIASDVAICGNGKVENGEQCDDSNVKDGDGCSKDCKTEACGNGVLDLGESCDDGNTADGDCCSSKCKLEHSASCNGTCGNGIIEFGEACDKDNLGYYTGMGAEKVCELFGYQMTSSAKVSCSDDCQIVLDCPVPKCGDGVLDDGEFCDGNLIRNNYTCQSIFGPGSTGTLKCDDTCLHTDKSSCTAPSTCGNGKVNGNEKCDPNLEDENKFLCSSYYPGSTGKRVCTSVCRWSDDACTVPSTCGNGSWDEGEDCDPSVFMSYAQSCALEMGAGSTGTVRCNEHCKFSYSLCTQSPACGNNKTDNGTNGTPRYHEVCDGTALNGKTCAKLLGSEYTGILGCLSNCSGYDYTNCKLK